MYNGLCSSKITNRFFTSMVTRYTNPTSAEPSVADRKTCNDFIVVDFPSVWTQNQRFRLALSWTQRVISARCTVDFLYTFELLWTYYFNGKCKIKNVRLIFATEIKTINFDSLFKSRERRTSKQSVVHGIKISRYIRILSWENMVGRVTTGRYPQFYRILSLNSNFKLLRQNPPWARTKNFILLKRWISDFRCKV
jgi:hypothetical protein